MRLRKAAGEEKEYGLADIHIHSSVSDGMADVSRILDFVAERTELDVISITDHDRIEGSYQARELAAKRGYHFDVVVGMEVTTLEGHLLALFLESPAPSLQPLEETIEAIHAQGGLCIVPHPMSWLTESVSQRSLERIVANSEPGLYLDGIETINSTIVGRISNQRAKRFNERYGLSQTGGSDSHFLKTVGSALTLFPGRGAQGLRRSLLERTSQARSGIRVRIREMGFVQIIRQQIRSRNFFIRYVLKHPFRGQSL
ncbi:MAG: PHP domain-containing protein [Dehalococcoidia bacterium]